MRKIKLITVQTYYEDYDIDRNIFHPMSDWEEVTEEEYSFIISNLYLLNISHSNKRVVLVEYSSEEDVPYWISKINETIIDLKKKEERRKKELEKRKAEEKRKRDEKKILREKAKFEKMIKENPDLLNFLKKD